MAKGGYKIIDLHNYDFTDVGTETTITGIYEELEGNYHKAVMLSNVTFKGIEITSQFVPVTISESAYKLAMVGVGTFTVTNDDKITLGE